MSFPIASVDVRTVVGLAFLITVIVEVIKRKWLEESRALAAIAVGVGFLFGLAAMLVNVGFRPTPEDWFTAVTTSVFAIAIAVLGYDVVVGLAGLAGYGPKSNPARLDGAIQQIGAELGPRVQAYVERQKSRTS